MQQPDLFSVPRYPNAPGFKRDGTSRAAFCDLWNTINGPGAWDQNPWVAAYTFRVLDTKGAGQ